MENANYYKKYRKYKQKCRMLGGADSPSQIDPYQSSSDMSTVAKVLRIPSGVSNKGYFHIIDSYVNLSEMGIRLHDIQASVNSYISNYNYQKITPEMISLILKDRKNEYELYDIIDKLIDLSETTDVKLYTTVKLLLYMKRFNLIIRDYLIKLHELLEKYRVQSGGNPTDDSGIYSALDLLFGYDPKTYDSSEENNLQQDFGESCLIALIFGYLMDFLFGTETPHFSSILDVTDEDEGKKMNGGSPSSRMSQEAHDLMGLICFILCFLYLCIVKPNPFDINRAPKKRPIER